MVRKVKTSFVFKLISILQILALILCYGMYLNKIIPPSTLPYIGILALIFPFTFGVYLLMTAINFRYKRKRSYFFIILSIPLFISLGNTVRIGFPPKEQKGIKALTYNVKYGEEEGFEDLNKYLKNSKADLIFLQEIYTRHWKKEAFLPDFYHAAHDYVGISSKYPIVFDAKIPLEDTNGYACLADIAVGKDTLRALSVYLGSLRLTGVLNEIEANQEVERNTDAAAHKLFRGFRAHEKQLKTILGYIHDSPYPVIVGGDFNSVPNSYEYYSMTYPLKDAFGNGSSGMSTSFEIFNFPARIDYIFISQELKSHHYEVDRSISLSDHYPASTFIEMEVKKSSE